MLGQRNIFGKTKLETTISLSAFMLLCKYLRLEPMILFNHYTYARMEKRVREYRESEQ